MSDLHFPRKDSGNASRDAGPLMKNPLGDHVSRLDIPEEPGRWVSNREMDAYFALHASEVSQLRAALVEIIAVLGPEVCDCDAHECGLADEANEAIHVAKLAMRGMTVAEPAAAKLERIRAVARSAFGDQAEGLADTLSAVGDAPDDPEVWVHLLVTELGEAARYAKYRRSEAEEA